MRKQLMMGNEAMARGAVEAGVQVVAAYPGTPSSEIVGTLARFARKYGYYVEWSTNEKVAMEVAAGAAYAGVRSLVAMKQVGLNVASDALMSLAYIGVKGGLVIIVADDPGPHSSQTEQDTRVFAKFAKLPVFNPATPQEAKDMVRAAFALSEREGMPVFLRPTTRVCHGCQEVTLEETPATLGHEQYVKRGRFERDPRWIIFPKLSYQRHKWLVSQEKKLAEELAHSPFNEIILPDGRASVSGIRTGILATGVSFCYVMEAVKEFIRKNRFANPDNNGNLDDIGKEISGLPILKIGTPYPLPEKLVLEFAAGLDRLLVVEEQDPLLEESVCALFHRSKVEVEVFGKETGHLPYAGEYSPELIKNALLAIMDSGEEPLDPVYTGEPEEKEKGKGPAAGYGVELPVRPPVFCSGCPHRASFYLVKEAAKGKDAVFTGDIGCYTLGNAPPLSALDTCLCMGAGVTIAIGLSRAEPGRPYVGFVGDSTFFHSCLTGLVNAVYNRANITLVVLDNSTTAMTGHQPHPGMGVTATGEKAPVVDIAGVCKALGVEYVKEVSPFAFEEFKAVAAEALDYNGPAVIVAKAPCIAVTRPQTSYQIDPGVCRDCKACLRKIGCPSISRGDAGVPVILSSCRGCGLCAHICPAGAIKEVKE